MTFLVYSLFGAAWILGVRLSLGKNFSRAWVWSLLIVLAGALGAHLLYCGEHARDFAARELMSGQSYFGALAVQLLLVEWIARKKMPPTAAPNVRINFAILTAASYGALKLLCAWRGCCYGKLCYYPWAVVYWQRTSLTPALGIPLHPVQIYSAIYAAILATFLWYFRDRLLPFGWGPFLAGFGAGRLALDPFRAQWLATHIYGAVLCLAVGIFMIAWAYKVRPFRALHTATARRAYSLLWVSALLLLSGCLPSAPGPQIVARTRTLSSGGLLHEMNHAPTLLSGRRIPRKNLILVVVDNYLFPKFQPLVNLLSVELPKPRFEEYVWRASAMDLSAIYEKVLRLRFDEFDAQSLHRALAWAEGAGVEYDLHLVVHGLPNYLAASSKRGWITWRDVASYRGKLRHLDTVFIQSCAGGSLARDWLGAGAKRVIAYPDLTVNLFFWTFWLHAQSRGLNPAQAYVDAKTKFAYEMTTDWRYEEIVRLLKFRSLDEYLRAVQMPSLYR